MNNKKILILMAVFLIPLAITGCGAQPTSSLGEQTQAALYAQATITTIAQQTALSQEQTAQAQPTETQQPTFTPTSTANPTPTGTQVPTQTPTSTQETPAGERIYFAANATRFHTEGTTSQAESKRYIVGAARDQLLDVSVTSAAQVAISIVGADGTVLVSPMGDVTHFRGPLPATQDYIITVRTTAASATFQLDIMIPVRIVFQTGEDTYETEGAPLPDPMTRQYSLYAQEGQTLEVEVTPNGDFALTIYGADGVVLMGSHNFGSTFSGTLPSAQYYIISVDAAPGVSSGYTLSIIVR